MQRRSLQLIVLAAVFVALGTYTGFLRYVDGNYDNGELVEWTLVGPLLGVRTEFDDADEEGRVSCVTAITDRCVDPLEYSLRTAYPDGLPAPIAEVTSYGRAPDFFTDQRATELGGYHIDVIRFADGTVHVRHQAGIGIEIDRRPAPSPVSP